MSPSARTSVWTLSLLVAAVAGYAVGARRFVTNAAGTSGYEPVTSAKSPSVSGALGEARTEARIVADGMTPPKAPSAVRSSPAADRERAQEIETLALVNPARALELALSERNLRTRALLRSAALRGWARAAPDAALDYALRLPAEDNRDALHAVLMGATARTPADCLRLAQRLTADDVPLAREYGQMAIDALADAGDYTAAVTFAASTASQHRADWLAASFAAWAEQDPAAALSATRQMPVQADRQQAWQAVVSGWARASPGELADYALTLPPSEDRAFALQQALPNWVAQEPAAASAWLSGRPSDPTLDVGLVSVATMPALLASRPEVAVEWAQAITDPSMRGDALRQIAEYWSLRTPDAFQRWLGTAPGLSSADRQALSTGLQPGRAGS